MLVVIKFARCTRSKVGGYRIYVLIKNSIRSIFSTARNAKREAQRTHEMSKRYLETKRR